MSLQETDLLLIQRGQDPFKATIKEMSDHIAAGYTGDLVIDGQTLSFVDGLLITIS